MSIGKKVLISGFEPFGGSDLNSSQLVVEAISKESLSGVELFSVILPVEFDKAARVLLSKVNDFNPEIIISFGQAEGRKAITPENCYPPRQCFAPRQLLHLAENQPTKTYSHPATLLQSLQFCHQVRRGGRGFILSDGRELTL